MRRFARPFRRALSAERLEARCLLTANVLISEFVASNATTLLDEDGDDSDWIELFNAGPDDVDLANWHLTDDEDDLSKWDFPQQTLPANSFLIVFASNKDRAIAGEPLHTNFKVSADGEYLALTHDDPSPGQPNRISVAAEFSPAYPRQFTDISYGVVQQVHVNQLLASTDSAHAFFPRNSQLGSQWREPDFNDAGWLTTTASIGYQQTVPGFTVHAVQSSSQLLNLAEAEATLSGANLSSETTAITPMVNFHDREGGGGFGNFAVDRPFPGDTRNDDNDFAVRATGTIRLPREGAWTFGTNSDDGVRLRVDGQLVINDDTLHTPLNRFGTVTLSEGTHDVELVYFEHGGGAEVELYAAPGTFSVFHTSFRLIGDLQRGGLVVETSPADSEAAGLLSLVGSDVKNEMFGRTTSAYLRAPVTVTDPEALGALTLRMRYDDGFVAYLNGTEVARRNAPSKVQYNSKAPDDRPGNEALLVEDIDISLHLGLLKGGSENVLAIQGLNEASDSDEFLLSAELAEINVDLGETLFLRPPTPGTFNPATGVEGFLTDEVQFSHAHGFYEDSFRLTLESATPGSTVRYTLDGSAPTDSNGELYSAPIRIDQTTTVRARAFQNGLAPSATRSATYLFLEDIVEQSPNGAAPDGFPSSRNINGQSLDYGMDRDIVNDREWGPQLEAALTQIPSMSLVMDVDDLLSPATGIYTNARSHGRDWERPASLELIQPDGSAGFQVQAGVRIRGGFSRRGENPKHAFRFFFREEYGDAKLRFPLFGEEGADEFDKIDLRTTQNYSWSFRGDERNAFVRDVFTRDVQRDMGQPYTRSRYYHLYINGQYWGLYQTQERAEARYAATYFGGNPNDYDVIKSAGNTGAYENEATDGNMDAYARLAEFFYQSGGLSDRNVSDYWRVQGMNGDGSRNLDDERLLDVDNLIDYMIVTYYSGDRDGPVTRFSPERLNNYFAVYNRENPDGFKFFEHDSEHSLDRGASNLVSQITSSGRQLRYFNPLWMHEQLASTNAEYRTRFSDAVYRHFNHGGVLTDEHAKSLIDARAAEFDMAIIAESARWGDAQTSSPFTKTDWLAAVDSARSWLDGRAGTVLEQFRDQAWYPGHDPAEFLVNGTAQRGGELLPSDIISLSAPGAAGYTTLLPQGAMWRYLDNGSNQGTNWQLPQFADHTWQAGRAELGYGDGDERTSVDSGPDASDKHRTTYFRTKFTVGDPQLYDILKIRLLRDDGAAVYLNGTEVIRSNLPSGPLGYRTEALNSVSAGEESTFLSFDVDPSLLRQGENVLAVEVHQVSGSSSDISFDVEVHGGNFSPVAGMVYYTLDGSDPRQPGGGVNPNAIMYDGIPFTPSATSEVRTRVLKGDEWSANNSGRFTVVEPPDTATPLAMDDTIQVDEGGSVAVLESGDESVLANDTGLDDAPIQTVAETLPQFAASFALNADGTFLYEHDGSENFRDSFAYSVRDANGQTDTATVFITITPLNDSTPEAAGEQITVVQGDLANRLDSGADSVLANDTGLEDTPIELVVETPPQHATSFSLATDGSFEYEHDGSMNFRDSFVYRVIDSSGESDTATVSITILAAGDLNADGSLDAADIDALVAAINSGSNQPMYDLDGSRTTDGDDLDFLVRSILGTRPGDTDLDGDVDFTDFVVLSENFGRLSTKWADGNFDFDGQVTFADFVLLAENFGWANTTAAIPAAASQLPPRVTPERKTSTTFERVRDCLFAIQATDEFALELPDTIEEAIHLVRV